MKSLIFAIITGALMLSCGNNRSVANQKSEDDTQPAMAAEITNTGPLKEIVGSYIRLKNDLAADNASGAADVGKGLIEILKNFDKSGLTPDQKKAFEDVQADAIENSEHISQSSGDIAHQREHFELLSNDVYELVKSIGGGQDLYRDFCPMYNGGKGAYWLSETKEIHNPYYGKGMATCGEIKEELK
jgi:hypothetical protein